IGEAEAAHAELAAAHEELAHRAAELARSNADLEQFAYVASHDLQEPLRKVASFTQLLARRYEGQLDARADEYIGYAVDGARRMQRLVDDLLGFARVGRPVGRPQDVDLAGVLDEVVADLHGLLDPVGARVHGEGLPVVRGDRSLLTSLLANLVRNAVTYRADDAPVVRLDARRVEDHWELSCQDNGVGIDPADAERVFGLFVRAGRGGGAPGTGIGLALCRRIVEHHGGRIWVDTTAASGASIRWTLPA
ncbi:MAG TPA: ATP-binding protein, partial [Actinotalea sp.]|nr:ATP-binding protein [Actinotalea sp.]